MSKKNSKNGEEDHKSGQDHGTTPKQNPLEKLKEKELQLRGRYLESKKQAEVIVAEARKKASDIRRASTDIAVKTAQEYYEKEVQKIRSETVKIGDEEVIQAKKIAEKNINHAREFLLKNIVPG